MAHFTRRTSRRPSLQIALVASLCAALNAGAAPKGSAITLEASLGRTVFLAGEEGILELCVTRVDDGPEDRVGFNGADTGLSCTVSGSAPICQDTTGTAVFASGDLFSIRVTPTGVPVGADVSWTARLSP